MSNRNAVFGAFMRGLIRGFIQTFLGIIGGMAVIGSMIYRIGIPLCSWGESGRYSIDLSWERMIPFYLLGMLIVFCGLVAVRLKILCEEIKYGPTLPYGEDDRSDRVGGAKSLLVLLPALPDRSESYFWSLTLMGSFLTFFLRDQTLNWAISYYGFTNPCTGLWDLFSLVGAPISAIGITIWWLAIWRPIGIRYRSWVMALQNRLQTKLFALRDR